MTAIFTGFPIQTEFNNARSIAWKQAYTNNSLGRRAANSLIHKELTAVCLITNTASAGIGAVGFALGATVLGTPKLLTFVCTAGLVRPTYSTGCIYNGKIVINSIVQVAMNTFEVAYDCGYIGFKCGETIHWTAKQLGFDGTLRRIVQETFKLIGKLGTRVAVGTVHAVEHEPAYTQGSPMVVAWINEPAKNLRIDFSINERSVVAILSHTAVSLANIPVNILACGSAGVIALPLMAIFAGKVTLNSITACDIPGPTYAGAACIVAGKTFYNVFADLGTVAADTGILIYKGANILRINALMATAIEFLYWSAGAIFS